MPFTVCGSWAAFLYALQGVFALCRAFYFCVCVRIYAAARSKALKRFLAALRGCFSFGVAVVVLLFVLVCSVMPIKLSVLRFVGVGGILYRVIFSVACMWFILAIKAISIFYHILPYFDKNITKSAPMDIDKNFTM